MTLLIIIKHKDHENNGNDPQVKKVLNVKEILLELISSIGNVWKIVWRICKLKSGLKGLSKHDGGGWFPYDRYMSFLGILRCYFFQKY